MIEEAIQLSKKIVEFRNQLIQIADDLDKDINLDVTEKSLIIGTKLMKSNQNLLKILNYDIVLKNLYLDFTEALINEEYEMCSEIKTKIESL